MPDIIAIIFESPPRWALMWLLASGLFLAGKLAMARRAGLHGWQHLAFTVAWVGMDARPFLPQERSAPAQISIKGPILNLLLGIILLWQVAPLPAQPLLSGWIGMAGLIFILHFGLFGLLAQVWIHCGVPVKPIMHCPIAATSLADFWGRRWNVAFRDLAHRLVFSPIAHRFGHGAALWASFGASGIAHECVISVPAGAGYGLPTAYFLLQAAGIILERRFFGTVSSKDQPMSRWLFTHTFTLLPAFAAFHPPFIKQVMLPFFHTLGALP